MIIDESKLEKLTAWLVKELTPLTDAKPKTLAKYVVVLLRSDRENEPLRQHCIAQLTEILKESTEKFIQNLFQTLKDDSFMNMEISNHDSEEDDDEEDNERDGRGSDEEEEQEGNRDSRRRNGSGDGGEDPSRKRGREEDNYIQQSHQINHAYDASSSAATGLNRPNVNVASSSHPRVMDQNYPPRYVPPGAAPNMFPQAQQQQQYGQFPNFGMPPSMFPINQSFPVPGTANMPNMSQFPPPVPPIVGNPMAANNISGVMPIGRPAPPPGPAPNRQNLSSSSTQLPPVTDMTNVGAMSFPPWNGQSMYPQLQLQQQQQQPYVPQFPQKKNDGNRQGFKHYHAPCTLPEEEQCTLKCTNIPSFVKEESLMHHFRQFGRVVQLQMIPSTEPDPSPDSTAKVFHECLVQFGDSQDAKKCLHSVRAVLNNRFIRMYISNFNIIPVSDVKPPTSQEIEEQRQYSSKKPRISTGGEYDGQEDGGRRRTPTTPFVKGKYINKSYVAAVKGTEGEGATAAGATTEKTAEESGERMIVDGAEGTEGAEGEDPESHPHKRRSTPQVPTAPSKADVALQQQYEGLRKLRGQADDIWKQKENLLQAQIEQYRGMIAKLESTEDSASKADLLEGLEGKIVTMQSMLRQVREDREKGLMMTNSSAAGGGGGENGYGGRGGRGGRFGRGGGQANRGVSSYRGGRGGRGGRGAPFAASYSIDNRPKALVVKNPPESFVNSVEEHFTRFGELTEMKALPGGSHEGIVVEFPNRRIAEVAKSKGSIYEGQLLNIDWYQPSNDQQEQEE